MEMALVIIYNHKYDKNIGVLEKVYRERFSNIFHLVPFYEGTQPNVIAVYGNSFYFQGYIAQGFRHFFKNEFRHYFFVADDMIINPVINERNYKDHLKLNDEATFIPRFINFNKECPWPRLRDAYHFTEKRPGLEAGNELPSYLEGQRKFTSHGLTIAAFSFDQLYDRQKLPRRVYRFKQVAIFLKWTLNRFKNKNKDYTLPYPLIGGYADFVILSAGSIAKFCHYSGVFAAAGLFVEVAIPTALVLSAEKIVTENDLELKGKAFWPEGWLNISDVDINQRSEGYKELYLFGNNLSNLLSNFPKNYLYIHPIKLSAWDTEI